MVYELRYYKFMLDNWQKYLELFNEVCLPIRKNDYGILKGKWYKSDTYVHFYHLWEYNSLNDRAELRSRLLMIEEWQQNFLKYTKDLLEEQYIRILLPFNPSQNIDLNQAIYLYQLDCKVGAVKNFADSIISSFNDKLVTITEFPNPNQLIIFTDHNSLIEDVNSDITTFQSCQFLEPI